MIAPSKNVQRSPSRSETLGAGHVDVPVTREKVWRLLLRSAQDASRAA